MERDISGIIRFINSDISISVIEKLTTSTVGIFNDTSNISDSYSFIEKSLQLIKRKIGANLKDFIIVIEDSPKVDSKISIVKEKNKLADYKVSKGDVQNIIELTKSKFITNDRKVTLIQPLRFKVLGEKAKSYSVAPIGKPGLQLEISFAVTTISSDVYNFINKITKPHGIVIKHILLSSQSITQNNLSSTANERGATLISVGKNNTSLSINRYSATVSTFTFYNFGYKMFVNSVSRMFKCDYKTALNLIDVYGDLRTTTNRVILNSVSGPNLLTFTEQDLIKLIKIFLNKLILVTKKFLEQKNVSHIPIVFSGKLKSIIGLESYVKEKLQIEVSSYTPLSIIENELNYKYAIGAKKLQKHLEDQKVIKADSIINTNPDDIRIIHSKMKKTLFDRIITKIGGKYDRN